MNTFCTLVPRRIWIVAAAVLHVMGDAAACPVDKQPRAAGTWLVVQGAGVQTLSLAAADLAAMPAAKLTQRLVVSSAASVAASVLTPAPGLSHRPAAERDRSSA